MNIALLVLRLVPGLLFLGHGLQKLVPARLSPPLLDAQGLQATAAGFRQIGLQPALPLALLTGASEVAGGFLIASGLVTPLGTALLAAVMTVAILAVHLPNGIWSSAGGLEFPLLMLASVFAVSALGPGGLSIDAWAGIANWTGVHWAVQDVVRSGAAVGVGAVAGLLAQGLSFLGRTARRERGMPSPAH
jgi:putative oxidoreductase